MLGHVVERVPGGVAWWLAVGRFRARWGVLVVRTEDSWGGGDERLPHGSVEECKRCDGSEVLGWLSDAFSGAKLRGCADGWGALIRTSCRCCGHEKSRGVVPGFFRGEEDPVPHL